MANNTRIFDICIVGSGLSGIATALAIPPNLKVCIIAQGTTGMNASSYAQGGIAVAMTPNDSPQQHANDTILCGCGLSDEDVSSVYTTAAMRAINWLHDYGVDFSKDPSGAYSLTNEGGHSHNRILHSHDETGKNMMAKLQQSLNKASNITQIHDSTVIDLIMNNNEVAGLTFLDLNTYEIKSIAASFFILATGGASGIYLNCTNPEAPCGDGMALAWRAGCRLANLEFNQFHPTCLYNSAERPLLISESLRGEGATLCDAKGNKFMAKYHPDAELATRDIVAKAIFNEIKSSSCPHVYLDITHKNSKWLKNRFPGIYRGCKSYGIDITKSMIPVVPASHYSCGGIVVDSSGKTDVRNLYAVGECSYTGLHGANRLASNSLLECVVGALNTANAIKTKSSSSELGFNFSDNRIVQCSFGDLFSQTKYVKKLMWDYVGLVRTTDGMKYAKDQIILLQQELERSSTSRVFDLDYFALTNLIFLAKMTIDSALSRKESRGVHFYQDYPEQDSIYNARPTLISNRKRTEVIA